MINKIDAPTGEKRGKMVAFSALIQTHPNWPTHRHSPEFWESLGRTIATLGFLEETLLKAIYSITGAQVVPEEHAQTEVAKWSNQLLNAVSDPLGRLINRYEFAIKDNPKFPVSDSDQILSELRKLCEWRNILCHSSWREPNGQGQSIPFFINNKKEIAQSPVDVALLTELRIGTVELICDIMNTVTSQGVQWPGMATREPT